MKFKLCLFLFAALVSALSLGCSSSEKSNLTEGSSHSNTNVGAAPQVVVSGNVTTGSSGANVAKNSKPMPTPKIGSGGDDMALFMKARGALATDPDLANNVIIEIKEGNALLSGKVASQEKKNKAEHLIRDLSGIKNVRNDLKLP